MNTSDITPEARAAHEILTDLRTTIALQPLPYQLGTEARALESLYEVFKKARQTVKDHPESERFAFEATRMLNLVLRPLTAKWHRGSEDGLLASRDGGDEFRGDLAGVQEQLQEFAKIFHRMAYGSEWKDELTVPVISPAEMEDLFKGLPFGIPSGPHIAEGKAPDLRENKNRDGYYGSGVQGINGTEAEDVRKRRAAVGVDAMPGTDAIGLAFSGGGIRSATFCLGVSQVLAGKDLLKEVDFLSTVSGGGYTGSFLTRQIGKMGGSWKQAAAPHGPDTEPLRYLRLHAKFLTARSLWEAWGMVTATVAGMIMNWMVPLLVLVVLAALVVSTKGLEQNGEGIGWVVGVGVGLSIVAGVGYFGFLRAGSRLSKAAGWFLAAAVAGWLAGLAWWGLNLAYGAWFLGGNGNPWPDLQAAMATLSHSPLWSGMGLSGLGVGAVSALVPVILRYLPLLKQPAVRVVVTKAALLLAGLFVPLLGLFVFLLLCAVGRIAVIATVGGFKLSGEEGLLGFAAILVILAVFFLNINLTGPHRLYRNGLSKTFVEEDEDKDINFPLKDLNESGNAPYHLINAAANLPSSTAVGMRERRCDFFLFSKYWTGSPVVGYEPSKDWKMNGKPADLATAMAISGAAFSANMGLGSIAPLRALLAFLNVRLGFWIRRPKIGGLWGLMKWKHPGFLCLLREMAGIGMAERDRWLNLSDGGHIENLAVYELLRRRCKFIVCVDGEADPCFTFQGLMTLVRHAQIDFGIRIDPDLSEIRPTAATGYSRSHFHLCRVCYPDAGPGHPAGTGLLLYVKLSVTGNESELIRRYRTNHPEFPHQTTLDQFFDEEQFEAYRQLGVHVAEGLFSRCLMNGKTGPTTVSDWFIQLASNLLLPKL